MFLFYLNIRLFEDKVYLAVLAKGINIKKNKYANEDGRDPTEDIETRISDKVGTYLQSLSAGKHSILYICFCGYVSYKSLQIKFCFINRQMKH